MLLFTTSRTILSTFKVKKLESDQAALLQLAAEWHHEKWGHIKSPEVEDQQTDKKKDVEERKKNILKFCEAPHQFYIVYCKIINKQVPVGMFALKAVKFFLKKEKIVELDDVYITREFRALGLGTKIIIEAKKIAEAQGCTKILLDTLNPIPLNQFYKKHGASVFAEGRCNKFPTDKLVIDLKEGGGEKMEDKRDRRRVSMK
jgi:GNAT superfamily N-acetyltransferase